jgi:predicted nucleotidyltransferase
MTGSLDQLLSEVKAGLQTLYGPRLQGVYLFGSYARGEQRSDSDVDILVVLDRVENSFAEIDRTGELVAGLSLDYSTLVSCVFVSLDRWCTEDAPFLDTVREDALAV